MQHNKDEPNWETYETFNSYFDSGSKLVLNVKIFEKMGWFLNGVTQQNYVSATIYKTVTTIRTANLYEQTNVLCICGNARC